MPAGQQALPVDFLAPVDGWRTDKPLEALPPTAASTLVNFFPEAGYIRPRNGSTTWTTATGASIGTLMPYFGASSNRMFAVDNAGNLWDISSPGAPVYNTSPGASGGYVSYVNFTNSGGNWLLVCPWPGGSNLVASYNGSTWAGAGITGWTTHPTVVTNYRSRLYFLEYNTSNLWFMPTLAITGALAGSINLGAIFKFGGLPVALGVWTTQTLNGPLQLLCILSSEGEVLIYTGSDPTNATNWNLLGSFKLGYPLGADRAFYQIGGDLAVMTVDGVVPLSKAITLDPSAVDQYALTGPIAPTWLSTVATVGRSTVGWQLAVHPSRRMAIINVPDPLFGDYQLVMNTETRAWTKFAGMTSTCWLSWNGNLYFGAPDGTVRQADVGANDNNSPIDCLSVGNWQRLKDGFAPKVSTLIAVDAVLDSTATVYAGASWDYVATTPQGVASGTAAANALWDGSTWDQSAWPGTKGQRLIADASGTGTVFAPTVRVVVNGTTGQQPGSFVIGGSLMIQRGQGI